MARTPNNKHGDMAGVGERDLVDAPASGEQHFFEGARFENPDTIDHTIKVYLKDSAGGGFLILIGEAILAAGEAKPFKLEGFDALKSTTEKVVGKQATATQTTSPKYWSSWIRCTA